MTTTVLPKNPDLKQSWKNLCDKKPHLRIRDAARELLVSEAELLATEIGETVIRLESKPVEILQKLDTLGRVMALTRNEEIVHERKGEYKNVEVVKSHGVMGLVVNEDIDLRIFFGNWHFAFAVTSENPRGIMRSFQFFDIDGTAVHKVFLTDESNLENYEKIVENFRSSDQSKTILVQAKPANSPEKPDVDIDVKGFQKAWSELKDTHDFFPMMRKFGVAREQALRLAHDEMAYQVDPQSFKTILQQAAVEKLPIMVFVSNAGIIQIHSGVIENVLEARGWFNVMDEKFNLHINQEEITSAWVVRKPTADGIVTSLEIFNKDSENVALFFGKRKPGIPEMVEWQELVSKLPKL